MLTTALTPECRLSALLQLLGAQDIIATTRAKLSAVIFPRADEESSFIHQPERLWSRENKNLLSPLGPNILQIGYNSVCQVDF